MGKAVVNKGKAFKAWKTGKGQMHCQTCNAPCSLRSQQEGLREYLPQVFHLANQFRGENTVVVGCKSVKKDAVEMSMSKDSIKAEGLVRALPKVSQC